MYDEILFIRITNTDSSIHEYECVDVIDYGNRKFTVLNNCEGLRIMEKLGSLIDLKDVPYETALEIVEIYRKRRMS